MQYNNKRIHCLLMRFAVFIGTITILCEVGAAKQTIGKKSEDIKASAKETVTFNELFDGTTCGPAAVYLVLTLYGKDVSLEEIGKETWIDTKRRTTVKSLSGALMKQGIYARGCKLTLKELEELHFPAIILIENPMYDKGENHFLVYVGSDEENIKLLNPLGFTALKTIPKEILKQEWRGVAIMTQLTPFVEYEKSMSRYWNMLMIGSMILLVIILCTIYPRRPAITIKQSAEALI